jgi:quercetin dioxygenase-like cupin family protein
MRMRTFIAAGLFAAALGFDASHARDDKASGQVEAQELFVEELAGDPNQEVVTHVYRFPPGAVLPWHIHPGAHEIVYVVEGDFTMEVAGKGQREYKRGESFYLAPNAVHRGMNQGSEPVKLFVARIKPKAKPLTEEVEPRPD